LGFVGLGSSVMMSLKKVRGSLKGMPVIRERRVWIWDIRHDQSSRACDAKSMHN
jgi:hypothetical protein